MPSALEVLDGGRPISYSFDDLLRYHGHGSPGGVAHAFKVLERSLPLLDPNGPCERREIVVETAFGGPGARDAFEMVTRGVTDDRFRVDASLARPDRGRALERFVFRLSYRDRSVTLALREGFVTDEFIDLARTEDRTPDQERRLDVLKLEMAERVITRPAAEVYDVSEPDEQPARPTEEPVRGFADAINRFDAQAAVALCDPEIEFLSVLAVSGQAYHGHEGIRQYFADISSAWEEWRVEVHRIAPAPDGRVVIVMSMHWRGRESGTAFSERTAHIWTLRDGKLLGNEPFREPEDALRALGLSL